MRRCSALLALFAALATAGCATPPRDRALAGLDLADPKIISELQDGLVARERAALATYALLHWEGSKAYCGQPMFRGPQPTTIGQAIDKTIKFENDLAAKRAAENRPGSALEQRVEEHRRLIDRFEEMSLELTQLQDSSVPPKRKAAEIAKLREAMAENRRERATLENSPVGPVA